MHFRVTSQEELYVDVKEYMPLHHPLPQPQRRHSPVSAPPETTQHVNAQHPHSAPMGRELIPPILSHAVLYRENVNSGSGM